MTSLVRGIITALPYLAEAALNLVASFANAILTMDWLLVAQNLITGLKTGLETAAVETLGTDTNIVDTIMTGISEKLPEDEFVWVDRGYLCNLYHVKQIKDNQMVLSTGQQLYIGERRLAQLKHRIMEYWQAGTMNGE